jgi:thiol-disulfide isomerase/thioredoxin
MVKPQTPAFKLMKTQVAHLDSGRVFRRSLPNSAQGKTMNRSFRTGAALLICCVMPLAQAKRAPNLELRDLRGNKERISDLRGSIAVVNFWATWCGPCGEELPLLATLSQEYGGKKVRFIAASVNEAKDRAKVDEFLSHRNLALEVWVGADTDMMDRAGLGDVLPATLILDEQGEIVARVVGEARKEDVKAPVDWLLSGRTGPAPTAFTKRY